MISNRFAVDEMHGSAVIVLQNCVSQHTGTVICKKEQARQGRACSFSGYVLAVAAAAKYEDEGEDDDPGAAIVEDVAKAVVVIHGCSPL
jgi:hypothetical protein